MMLVVSISLGRNTKKWKDIFFQKFKQECLICADTRHIKTKTKETC